jgi:septal ring factor EnvC (AmiA/AmiB activator)
MKYLFLLFLAGCTLSAQQQDAEKQKDAEFEKLIKKATESHSKFGEVHKKAKAKEEKLVAQAITKIVTLKAEVKELKSEISEMKVRIDTVYIHDTIQIKEKKNFWGKTKVDTTNKE